LLLALTAHIALAGYGDPIDGIPNAWERELHVWTNAARVEPEAFAEHYDCGFDSFKPNEQEPQMPLLWEDGLGDAARFHTDDMADTNNFSHTSSDGTSFGARLERYYSGGYVGENIAMGYGDPWEAVIIGWMCSTGHRENIMSSNYEELGTGVRDTWYTQDFGAQGVDIAAHSVRLGAHIPENPGGSAELIAAFYDASGADVVRLRAIVNGVPKRMKLAYGTESSGIFSADIDVTDSCTAYFFEAELADGTFDTYPEEGVYGFGTCDWVDQEAQWMHRDADGMGFGDSGPEPEEERDAPAHREWRKWPFAGCNSTGTRAGWTFLVLLPLLARRRR